MLRKRGIIFSIKESFAFITDFESEKSVFFHRSALDDSKFEDLRERLDVEYIEKKGRDGRPAAAKVFTKISDMQEYLRNSIPYNSLNFGKVSAEKERIEYPDLLISGFFHLNNAVKYICKDTKFLVLGHKGSGKSALREHIRLSLEDDPNYFINDVYLADFPFVGFSKIIEGDDLPETKYPKAWSWLLILLLLDSFSRDNGSPTNEEPEFVSTIKTLKQLNLFPHKNLNELTQTSMESSFKIKIPPIFEAQFKQPASNNTHRMLFFVEKLKTVLSKFKSPSKHFLFIDGLDDILTTSKIQYDSLGALILEVSRLNIFLMENVVPAKIILLCRTDLFERLPGPNKNKIRQDSAIYLDWYRGAHDVKKSHLVKLAEQRASLTNRKVMKLFELYFPKKYNSRSITKALLDYTRHTPRDFMSLLKAIQHHDNGGKLSDESIAMGLEDYSTNYLLPEIRDELDGYLSKEEIGTLFELLGSIRDRRFLLKDIQKIAEQGTAYENLDLYKIFSTLFECGAVGNITRTEVDSDKLYMTFKFRNKDSFFNQNEQIIIQYGLWRALNIRYRLFEPDDLVED